MGTAGATFLLPRALPTAASPSRRRGAGQALVLRSRIHLSEMVPHPAFGVCFQLEYVFGTSGIAEGKVGLGVSCLVSVPR